MLQGSVKIGCPQWISAGKPALLQQLDDRVDGRVVGVVPVEQGMQLDAAEARPGLVEQPAGLGHGVRRLAGSPTRARRGRGLAHDRARTSSLSGWKMSPVSIACGPHERDEPVAVDRDVEHRELADVHVAVDDHRYAVLAGVAWAAHGGRGRRRSGIVRRSMLRDVLTVNTNLPMLHGHGRRDGGGAVRRRRREGVRGCGSSTTRRCGNGSTSS